MHIQENQQQAVSITFNDNKINKKAPTPPATTPVLQSTKLQNLLNESNFASENKLEELNTEDIILPAQPNNQLKTIYINSPQLSRSDERLDLSQI